jgi:hypothetical protein
MKLLNTHVLTLLNLSTLIFAAASNISSTLFLSVAEVKITETQGKNSIFDLRYSIYLFIIFSLSTQSFASTLSHLFTTITSHLFSSKAFEIIDKS